MWRREGDSNPRYLLGYDGLANRWIKPLSHLSVGSPEQKPSAPEKIRETGKKYPLTLPGGGKAFRRPVGLQVRSGSPGRNLAEEVGFEPTVPFPVRRFSRPLP